MRITYGVTFIVCTYIDNIATNELARGNFDSYCKKNPHVPIDWGRNIILLSVYPLDYDKFHLHVHHFNL